MQTPPVMEIALMTPKEAAAFLSIPISALNRARRHSGLPAVRIGTGVIRYRRESLLSWIEEREASEGPAPRAAALAPRGETSGRPAVSLLE